MMYMKELLGLACNMDWIICSSSVERLLTPDSGWAERQMADWKDITTQQLTSLACGIRIRRPLQYTSHLK